jgi:hypothetical protein
MRGIGFCLAERAGFAAQIPEGGDQQTSTKAEFGHFVFPSSPARASSAEAAGKTNPRICGAFVLVCGEGGISCVDPGRGRLQTKTNAKHYVLVIFHFREFNQASLAHS